jgi:enoyl-[acyl-carrier protein] reductase I
MVMMQVDLSGKRALIAGIADERGFGYAIAQRLAAAGASVCAATWPPAYNIFNTILARAKQSGPNPEQYGFERVYPLDARFDLPEHVPADIRNNRRYRELDGFTIHDLSTRLVADFGARPLDIVVHCIANGPEVTKPLLETSRAGYLEALSASSFSFIALAQRLSPLMREGASMLCLSFIASERVIPGYGGGMSSAKAALESDTRVLAFELGRRDGLRVNCISAAPWPSRAAASIGFIEHMAAHVARNAPIAKQIIPVDVADVAAFLVSPLARAVTGSTIYVDYGSHCMGIGFSSAVEPSGL